MLFPMSISTDQEGDLPVAVKSMSEGCLWVEDWAEAGCLLADCVGDMTREGWQARSKASAKKTKKDVDFFIVIYSSDSMVGNQIVNTVPSPIFDSTPMVPDS